jgi:GNAT superfamily N-acetyltransferase
VRDATAADVPQIRAVSRAAGQPSSDSGADAGYVRHILEIGSAVVGEAGGRVVGWAAVTAPGGRSMLSDLFVHPDHQGRGVGSRLLAAVWPRGQHPARFTFSSSHPAALTVYLRASLLPRWPLFYLAGPPLLPAGAGTEVVAVTAAEAAAADDQVTGGQRSADYAYWTSHLDAEAFVITCAGAPAAVGARTATRVIHLACRDDADPVAVVMASLAAPSPVGEIAICLPGPHPALPVLTDLGYRVVEHDIAMGSEAVQLASTHAYSPALA